MKVDILIHTVMDVSSDHCIRASFKSSSSHPSFDICTAFFLISISTTINSFPGKWVLAGSKEKLARSVHGQTRLDTCAENPPTSCRCAKYFFVRYNTEKNTCARIHADERWIKVSAEAIDPNRSLGNEPQRRQKWSSAVTTRSMTLVNCWQFDRYAIHLCWH